MVTILLLVSIFVLLSKTSMEIFSLPIQKHFTLTIILSMSPDLVGLLETNFPHTLAQLQDLRATVNCLTPGGRCVAAQGPHDPSWTKVPNKQQGGTIKFLSRDAIQALFPNTPQMSLAAGALRASQTSWTSSSSVYHCVSPSW